MNVTTKTNEEMTTEELAERNARRDVTRAQILTDQRTDAKRDKKALACEAAWFRKFSQE